MTSNKKTVLCTAGVLKRDQSLLIAQRPEGKSFAGWWEFPGGKIEDQETPEDALTRELHEELGIIVETQKLQKILDITYEYPNFHLSMPTFLCEHWENDPQGCEGQTLQWVTLKEFSDYQILPANEPIIPTLLKFFKNQ